MSVNREYMNKMLILSAAAMLLFGCSVVSIGGGDTYQRQIPSLPQEKSLSVEAIGSMASASTQINKVLNKVYYEGIAKLDPVVEFALQVSYHLAGWTGIFNKDIDITDPQAVKEFYKGLQKAETEKLEQISDLREQVKKTQAHALEQEKYRKAAEDERKTLSEKVWMTVKSILGALLGIFALAFLLEVFTPVKAISWLLPWVSRRTAKTLQSTVKGVQAVRSELKYKVQNGGSEEEKRLTAAILQRVDELLEANQDTAARTHIMKIKDEI